MPCFSVAVEGRAARARALHVEIDDAFLVAAEGDVAAVVGDGRPHARLDQVLDGRNRLGVRLIEEFLRGFILAAAVRQQRRAGTCNAP